MYQTVNSKSPLFRKLLLFVLGVAVVSGIIFATNKLASSNESQRMFEPEIAEETALEPEQADQAVEPEVLTDVADAESETLTAEAGETPDTEELVINERLTLPEDAGETEETESVEVTPAPAQTPNEPGRNIQVNRVTVVEQPDLSNVFQVATYLKSRTISGLTTDGRKVIINGDLYHIDDFIEGSQTIKYKGKKRGALLFEAHGKQIQIRL